MNQDAPDPAGPAEHELSTVLDRFEEAWQEGTDSSIWRRFCQPLCWPVRDKSYSANW